MMRCAASVGAVIVRHAVNYNGSALLDSQATQARFVVRATRESGIGKEGMTDVPFGVPNDRPADGVDPLLLLLIRVSHEEHRLAVRRELESVRPVDDVFCALDGQATADVDDAPRYRRLRLRSEARMDRKGLLGRGCVVRCNATRARPRLTGLSSSDLNQKIFPCFSTNHLRLHVLMYSPERSVRRAQRRQLGSNALPRVADVGPRTQPAPHTLPPRKPEAPPRRRGERRGGAKGQPRVPCLVSHPHLSGECQNSTPATRSSFLHALRTCMAANNSRERNTTFAYQPAHLTARTESNRAGSKQREGP